MQQKSHVSRRDSVLFLAERMAQKVPGVNEKPAPLKKIGILGAGLMGGGIAMCFVQKGVPVVLKDAKQEWLDDGMKKVQGLWGGQAKRGRLSQDKYKQYMSLLKPTLDYADFKDLLENVRTSKSSTKTLATGMAMGKLISKKAIMVGNCDGFVGNRMIAPYAGEAKMVLEEGASIEQVDAAAQKFGMAMGPMALGDLVGLELFWKQRKAAGDMKKQTKTYYGPYELTDHPRVQRAKIKRTARQRAMRDRKKQTWDPKLVMETLADFKKHLRRTYGSYLRAWRLVLSPNDSVTVSRTQFLTACSALGFKDAGKVLWRAFGRDELSPISLDFLDPESAEVLAHFQQLVQQLGGVSAAFRVFDKKDVKRIKMPEFISTLNSLDASLPAKQLFYGLDTDANGRLEIEDFKFLEKWKLPEFLIASPSEEAKEEVKRDLLVTYKTYLKAWRLALDENNSNRCTWPEFQSACRKVNFTGDVAGAWRALDTDLSGSITLQEVDYESSATLATFKKWADENFGGIRSAFMVFDADGSNGVTLREWRHACRIYGFHQGASSLFKQLDAEGVGSLSLDQVAFLDDWDFQPEKTAMSTTPSQHSPARTERKVAPGGFSQPQSPAAAGAKHKILRRPQGLALPSRVVWGELPCKRPRPPPRGPGTGLPRAWCCKCRARGPCRHFARADGVRSLAPSPRTAGYDALMSPDPLEPPAVKYSRYRWLRERIKPSTTRRPHTSPAVPGSDPRGCVRAEVEGEVSEDRPHELSIAFPDLANSQRSSDSLGAQVQLMALQHFPMGTWDFPLPFLASSPSRQLLLQAV
eukprot:s596_g3.t1